MSEEDRLKLVETANRLEPLATGELLGFGFDVADLIDSVTRLFYSVVMAALAIMGLSSTLRNG